MKRITTSLILFMLISFVSCDTLNRYTARVSVDREPSLTIINQTGFPVVVTAPFSSNINNGASALFQPTERGTINVTYRIGQIQFNEQVTMDNADVTVILTVPPLPSTNTINGSLLSGIWIEEIEEDDINHIPSIEFIGNNFTITEYPFVFWNSGAFRSIPSRNELVQKGIDVLFSRITSDTFYYPVLAYGTIRYNKKQFERYIYQTTDLSFPAILFFDELPNLLRLTLIDSHSSIYGEVVAANKVELLFERVLKGTYSITNDRIELIFQDGAIEVFPFSRTGNIITINDFRYTRIR